MNTSSYEQNPLARTVAVIGAGMAGLSCAQVLRAAGISVTVFEKSRGTGGRMSTRRAGDFQCDHGAQYFTARDPSFVTELDNWLKVGVAQEWQAVLRSTASGDSPDIRSTAMNNKVTRRFVGTPRMNSPLHFMSQGLDIQLSTLVTNIRHSKTGWHVQLERNDSTTTLLFDAVVLAIPAPQADSLLPVTCSSLRAMCGQHQMFACWAVMLSFDQRLPVDFDAMFVNEGQLSWVARNSSKPGRPGPEVWLLHGSREWSTQHLERSPEQVAEALTHAFCELTGLSGSACKPDLSYAHRWRYAQSEHTAAESPPESHWDNHRQIGLCGDWLHGGRIEGAWLSGRLLAEQVLMSR